MCPAALRCADCVTVIVKVAALLCSCYFKSAVDTVVLLRLLRFDGLEFACDVLRLALATKRLPVGKLTVSRFVSAARRLDETAKGTSLSIVDAMIHRIR